MSLDELQTKILNCQAHLGVIGLGYVGLPVACMFAEAGFQVIGLDIKGERVAMINAGISPIEGDEPGLTELLAGVINRGNLKASDDYLALANCDIILIDVETPVDVDHKPRYSALRAACQSLGPVLKHGALVIVESTIAPGTISQVVQPEIENATRKKLNQDFFLGACPERVMPGRLLSNLKHMSRVCGGSTPETSQVMVSLYQNIVQADLDMADPLTAELVKTTENAYRDVQIAFANEVAMICEASGGDVWRVRELVNKSPYRQMHLPGAGVGGHCIPKDPWLLAYSIHNSPTRLRVIPAARAVNDEMPVHMIELLQSAFAEAKRSIHGSRILILGYAYLEDSDDTRNSPSETLVAHLESLGATSIIHDPYVDVYQGDLYEMAEGCDAAILMVRHKPYLQLDLAKLSSILQTPVLIEGRNIFSLEVVRQAGFVFRKIGVGV